MTHFSIVKETRNPWNGKWEDAIWHTNYMGYLRLVEFSGGRFWNPMSASLDTK